MSLKLSCPEETESNCRQNARNTERERNINRPAKNKADRWKEK